MDRKLAGTIDLSIGFDCESALRPLAARSFSCILHRRDAHVKSMLLSMCSLESLPGIGAKSDIASRRDMESENLTHLPEMTKWETSTRFAEVDGFYQSPCKHCFLISNTSLRF
jgi:hypothetical protein